MGKARGRLSAIDLLPEECDQIITWASQELANRDRSQTDIYGEFKEKMIALQGEIGLGFVIPSFQAFNRFSIRLSQMTRRLEQTREISAILAERMDAEGSDELTLIAAESLKTVIFELLQKAGEAGLATKEVNDLASALKNVTAAQNVSTIRRQKVEAEVKSQAEKVIETVGKEGGLSAARRAEIKRDFLGVRPKEKKK